MEPKPEDRTPLHDIWDREKEQKMLPAEEYYHRDGTGYLHQENTPWYRAPLPRRIHRCTPWSSGYISAMLIERCACGGVRLDVVGRWMEKNRRRKKK